MRQLAVGAALHLPAPYHLPLGSRRRLARAALLHDIGRIGAPATVLARVLDLADRALVTETFTMAEAGAHAGVQGSGQQGVEDPLAEGELMTALVSLADMFEALIAPGPRRTCWRHRSSAPTHS